MKAKMNIMAFGGVMLSQETGKYLNEMKEFSVTCDDKDIFQFCAVKAELGMKSTSSPFQVDLYSFDGHVYEFRRLTVGEADAIVISPLDPEDFYERWDDVLRDRVKQKVSSEDTNALSYLREMLEQLMADGRTSVDVNGIYGSTNMWGYLGMFENQAIAKRARHILLKESVTNAARLIGALRQELFARSVGRND